MQLSRAELGYQPDSVLVMYLHLPAKSEAEYLGVQRRAERLYSKLAELPGVAAVSAAMGLPAGKYGSNAFYEIEGRQDSPRAAVPRLPRRPHQPTGAPALSN